jgi:hypothetical protein
MIEFKWNGGGEWNRKAWSADLPTDSSILFYLFAAFLAAPKWVFTNEDPSRIESPNGVLYLGKIPPRVTGEYYAIIPTRPPAKSKVRHLIQTATCSVSPRHEKLTIEIFFVYRELELWAFSSAQESHTSPSCDKEKSF